MKTHSKRIVTALLALLVLLSGILALTVSRPQKTDASAATEASTGILYYFTDYYPTLSREMIEERYGTNFTVDWDHQYINAEMFDQMLHSGYFTQFSNRIAIIDIKTFMPEPAALVELFRQLREGGCRRIAFVSAYDQSMFPDLGFMKYIDQFICDSEMMGLNNFIDASLAQLTGDRHLPVERTAYLIDRNLIPLHTQEDWERFQNEGIVYLFRYSPFLRHLVWKLSFTLGSVNSEQNQNEGHLTEEDYRYYEKLADELFNHDISFLSCLERNLYVNLLTRELVEFRGIDSFMTAAGNNIRYLCAFGFWELDQASYDSWYEIEYGMGYDLPTYILNVDDVQYNPNGLKFITDSELRKAYPGIYERRDIAALELMEFLRSAL